MSKAELKIVPIHLVKPHRHAGRDYKAGTPEKPTVLKLREDKAEWLVAEGTAEWPPADNATAAKATAPAASAASAATTKPKE